MISSDTALTPTPFAELRGPVWALAVGVVVEEACRLLEVALERLSWARAKLMDLISRERVDGLGEVLGDVNKAVGDLEQALRLLRGRRA
jgi:hypothetical protein